MKPTNRFYVGGPPLDPPDDDEPEDGLTDAERQQKAFDDFDPPVAEYGE